MTQYRYEILIYINQVKKFLESNKDAKIFFLSDIDPDIFFDKVSEISEKNFEETGEPQLTIEQYQKIKNSFHQKKKPVLSIWGICP